MFIRGTIKNYHARNLQQIIVFKDGFKTGCYCTTEYNWIKIQVPYRNVAWCHLHHPKRNKKNTVKNNEINESSLRRSKMKVQDYALSDHFDLFITLTFDPQKIDSLDHELTKKHVSKWLNNLRRTSPDLKYILVPELHKSGALHFHGMFKNLNLKLQPSLTPTGRLRKDKGNRPIYNLPQYSYGWSTAVELDGNPATAYYITKYMKKDMLNNSVLNKKRYWVSRNLQKPISFTFSDINQVPQINDVSLALISTFKAPYYTKYTRSTIYDYINLTAIEKTKKTRYPARAKRITNSQRSH